MSDETPLESLLPEEAIAQIRKVIAEILSQKSPPQASIGGKAAIAAVAQVIQLQGIATAEAFGSATLQVVDAAEAKKRWASPEGVTAIAAIVSIIIALYAVHLTDVQGHRNEAFVKELIKEIEDFVITLRNQPQPKPTPDETHPPSPNFSRD